MVRRRGEGVGETSLERLVRRRARAGPELRGLGQRHRVGNLRAIDLAEAPSLRGGHVRDRMFLGHTLSSDHAVGSSDTIPRLGPRACPLGYDSVHVQIDVALHHILDTAPVVSAHEPGLGALLLLEAEGESRALSVPSPALFPVTAAPLEKLEAPLASDRPVVHPRRRRHVVLEHVVRFARRLVGDLSRVHETIAGRQITVKGVICPERTVRHSMLELW